MKNERFHEKARHRYNDKQVVRFEIDPPLSTLLMASIRRLSRQNGDFKTVAEIANLDAATTEARVKKYAMSAVT